MALDVAHPGPAPEPFEFPFARARAALRAVRAAADELGVLVARHRAAVGPARVGFEGETRRQFDDRFEAAMEGMQAHRRALDAQADVLEADLRTAETRRDASIDARDHWQRRHDAYASAGR